MSSKMGFLFGLLIVIILVSAMVVGYNEFSVDSKESIQEQSTTNSIQETLLENE